MPGVRGYRLADLRRALVEYASAQGRRPTLEYAMIHDVNDTEAELEALVTFCRGLLAHVNLIAMNPVEGSGYDRSRPERLARFERALRAAGVEASVRLERGADIDAACGQLVSRPHEF